MVKALLSNWLADMVESEWFFTLNPIINLQSILLYVTIKTHFRAFFTFTRLHLAVTSRCQKWLENWCSATLKTLIPGLKSRFFSSKKNKKYKIGLNLPIFVDGIYTYIQINYFQRPLYYLETDLFFQLQKHFSPFISK